MPKGKCLKQYRPYGEIKVVSKADSRERGICQNPELASKVENTVAPASCVIVCSTAGKGCLSRQMLSFNLLRSTQMRTFPLGLGTTTSPAHHSVGCSTLSMTPNASILVSSSLTFGRRGIATLQDVLRENGLAPLSSKCDSSLLTFQVQ